MIGISVIPVARAEDGGVAESLSNSFKPDRTLQAQILPDSQHSSDVKKIEWMKDSIKVVTRYFGSSSESTLRLEGVLKKPKSQEWHLVWSDRNVELNSQGEFTLTLPYESNFERLQLVAVGPQGEVEYHLYQIKILLPEVPTPAPILGELPDAPTQSKEGLTATDFNSKLDRRLFVSPGLGITHLSFSQDSQSSSQSYQSFLTTVKVSANYLLFPPKWDLGATGFLNVVSLSKSSASDVRVLGMNLRMGYIFPEVKAPWRLSLYGGWYYSTMLATDQSFGYRNISGPQLYPSIRRVLDNGHAVSGYFKFSPISSALSLMKLSNNELAVGFAYSIPTSTRTYGITLDFARVTLTDDHVPDDIATLTSSSVSLGGSVTF
jgi:hypothetical protein